MDGTVYIGFGKTQNVLQLDLLLPASLRGLTYDEVRSSDSIRQYFELANMVLISAEAMHSYMQSLDMTGVTKANPAKVHVPSFDLDYLKLREADGKLLPQRLQALFTVVTAYWESNPKLGLKTGLVAGLWRRGMPASEIIRSISASTGKDGQLIKSSGRDSDIMHVVIDAYFDSKGLPSQSELTQSDATELVNRWLTATRSVALGHKDVSNTVLHWADYRQLGLIDQAGVAQLDQVRLIAQKVFAINGPLSFEALSAWVEKYHAPKRPEVSDSTKAARAKLQQKRKQGKLNRKKGR